MPGFRLTQEMQDEGFSGGTVSCGALGETFNVGQALRDGDGLIYTDSDLFATVLAQYPALERVSDEEIPEGAKPVEIPASVAGSAGAVPLAPWTPQTPDAVPQMTVEPYVEGTEIPAEHQDSPATEDEAVQAGERVSGSSTPSSWESSQVGAAEADTDESSES